MTPIEAQGLTVYLDADNSESYETLNKWKDLSVNENDTDLVSEVYFNPGSNQASIKNYVFSPPGYAIFEDYTLTDRGTRDFSFIIWAKIYTFSSGYSVMFSNYNNTPGDFIFGLYNGKVTYYTPELGNFTDNDISLEPGRWYQYAVVRESNVTKIYVNSINNISTNDTSNLNSTVLPRLGYTPYIGTLNGELAIVKTYDRALTQNEINSTYIALSHRFYTPYLSQTPTNTRTPTNTKSITVSKSYSRTPTNSNTVGATPTQTLQTQTPTSTKTTTHTYTNTLSPTPTITSNQSPTSTRTVTPTNTPTNTQTRTQTNTRTPTNTRTNTRTSSVTKSTTPTLTKNVSRTRTPTITKSISESKTSTRTPTYTRTNEPTRPTPTRTRTRTPTRTYTPTHTRTRTMTVAPWGRLVGHYDAENVNSYNPALSGNQWYNIGRGGGAPFTLHGSPNFVTNTPRHFKFNETDDYMTGAFQLQKYNRYNYRERGPIEDRYPYSYIFWIRVRSDITTSFPTQYVVPFVSDFNIGYTNYFMLGIRGALSPYAGYLEFWERDEEGREVFARSNYPINDNGWHQVAFVAGSTYQYIYIDGSYQGRSNAPRPEGIITNGLPNVWLEGNGSNLDADLAIVKIYTGQALSQGSITSTYNQYRPRFNLPPVTPTPTRTQTQTITNTHTGTVTPTVTQTHTRTKTQTPTGVVQTGLVLNLDAGDSSSYPGTGSTWSDLTSRGNDATIGSGTTYSSFGGGSFYFNQSNATISPNSDFAPGTGDFTLAAWVYPESLVAPSGGPLIWSQSSSTDDYFYMGLSNDRQAIVINSTDIYGNDGITTDKWWHFVIKRVNGQLTFYLNGTPYTSDINTFNFNNTSYTPTIGNYTQSLNELPWSGYIATMRYYKGYGLSTNQVIAQYNAQRNRFNAPITTPYLTQTRTLTPTNTQTPTYTNSNTKTPFFTPTHTKTGSYTPTNTITPTYTPTTTKTNSLSPTNTITPTYTPTNTYTSQISPSPTNTKTNTQTRTKTETPTNTSSITTTPTVTRTNTLTPTNTITNTQTSTIGGTLTNTPTITLTQTLTQTPTNTRTITTTPTNTSTQTNTPTTPPEFDTTLTVVTPGNFPSQYGVTLQGAVNDQFSFNKYTSGTGGINTMYIYLNGSIKAVIPYSLNDYTGDDFKIVFGDGSGTYRGTFTNGNVYFTSPGTTPTPTATLTQTKTSTNTITQTRTSTNTTTQTRTIDTTPEVTSSSTTTRTSNQSPTSTRSVTPTQTDTPTGTPSVTITKTITPTVTYTPTVTNTNTVTSTVTVTSTGVSSFDTSLTVVTLGDWPAAYSVLLQSAVGDTLYFNRITSGTGAVRTMYIYLNGNVKSVVNYSLAEYDDTTFEISFNDGSGTYRGLFKDGNVYFTSPSTTPTPTITITSTRTTTPTSTSEITQTPTPSPTVTRTISNTNSPTPTITSTRTSTYTMTPTATTVGPDWTPSDVNVVAWIDASDSSSWSSSGSTLTSVTDKAGTYSMTVGGTPTTNNTQNGLNVFTFSGSNEYLQSTAFRTQTSSGNHWAIGVFRYDTTDNSQDSFWSYETNQSPKRDYAISSASSSNTWPGELDLDGLSSGRISNTIGNLQSWNSASITRLSWAIVVANFNKSGNQISVRVNGSNAFTPVNDYTNSISPNQELRLMRNRASQELAGRLGEFFTVADIPGTGGTDISDIEKAEGYLAWKWGLVSSLPSDHPYKNSAPTIPPTPTRTRTPSTTPDNTPAATLTPTTTQTTTVSPTIYRNQLFVSYE